MDPQSLSHPFSPFPSPPPPPPSPPPPPPPLPADPRLGFPRFFFLSSEQLLDVLANAGDVKRVMSVVRQCFQGVHDLVLREGGDDIVGMVSDEGEEVLFQRQDDGGHHEETGGLNGASTTAITINPGAVANAVEVWLSQVEKAMQRAVRRDTDGAMVSFETSERSEWIQEWPGQVVLSVSQVHWARKVG